MRFNPPRIALPVELAWLLDAAFGPTLSPLDGEPAAAGRLARLFDLGPRIVARHGAAALEGVLGDDAAESIQAHRRGVAIALAYDLAARRLAELAAGRGLSIVFLKGYALERLLAGPPGWRPYADLDVLLARAAGEELRELLIGEGWLSSVEAANPQHLPPISSPQGTPVDIHYRLRGIQVAAARWATADELLEADLCLPAGLGDRSWVPTPALMAAHIAVHALEQHGHRPSTYPLLRAVADIADLVRDGHGEDLASPARQLVADSLAEEEVRALFRLAHLVAQGRTPPDGGDDEDSAGILLRHIVAGAMDPAYRQGLTLDHTAGRLREARRDGALMRYIAHKLKSPNGPPEAVADGSARRSGSWRQRLLHPIRLFARFAAAAAARLRRGFDR